MNPFLDWIQQLESLSVAADRLRGEPERSQFPPDFFGGKYGIFSAPRQNCIYQSCKLDNHYLCPSVVVASSEQRLDDDGFQYR